MSQVQPATFEEGQTALQQGIASALQGDLRIIVLTAQVPQKNMGCPAVISSDQKFSQFSIRKMAVPAAHPLFQVPGVGTDLEHPLVMIRFDQQPITRRQMLGHRRVDFPQIGHYSSRDASGTDAETYRLDGIVRDGKRSDLEFTNLEFLSRLEFSPAIVSFRGRHLRKGSLIHVDWDPFASGEGLNPLTVIGVSMGQENGIHRQPRKLRLLQTPCQRAGSEADVHQDTSRSLLHQSAVSAAAAAKYANPHAKLECSSAV